MSEVLEPPVTHPVTAALEDLRAALDAVVAQAAPGADSELWTMSGPELLEAAEAVHRMTCRADAVLHGLVREIDARGAATDAGAHSTAGWLRSRLHLHPGAARRDGDHGSRTARRPCRRPRPPRGRAAGSHRPAPAALGVRCRRHLGRARRGRLRDVGGVAGLARRLGRRRGRGVPRRARHAARPEGAGPAGPAPAARAGQPRRPWRTTRSTSGRSRCSRFASAATAAPTCAAAWAPS